MMVLSNISAGYGGPDVVKNVSVSAQTGTLIALVGPNGSGKSTLLRTIAGLIRFADGGSIHLDDKDLYSLTAKERAKKIAYLAQTREAQADMKVKDMKS